MTRYYSQKASVDRIPGIGEKRCSLLSTIGIDTIADFLRETAHGKGQARVAKELGVSVGSILALREKALAISGQKLPAQSADSPKKKAISILRIAVGLFLIISGALVAGRSFQESRTPSFTMIILEDRTDDQTAFDWEVVAESTLTQSGVLKTKMWATPDLKEAFSLEYPKSIPEGLLLPFIPVDQTLQSLSAKIEFVETEIKTIEGAWVAQADGEKEEMIIPHRVKDISDLENYPGINLLIEFDLREIPEAVRRGQRIDFSVELEFADKGFAHPFNRYTGGSISVIYFLSSTAKRFLGIGKEKFSPTLDFPGQFLKLAKGVNDSHHAKYLWRSDLSGEFTSPDELIGAKQFWIDGQDRLEGTFVFKTYGLKWLSYIAAILGLPMVTGGITLLKRSHDQLRSRYFG